VPAQTFQGVVEESRELEAGLRWWPASGVDLRALAAYRWVENESHVPGQRAEHTRVAFEVVLRR
jgi:hypothetical protein